MGVDGVGIICGADTNRVVVVICRVIEGGV